MLKDLILDGLEGECGAKKLQVMQESQTTIPQMVGLRAWVGRASRSCFVLDCQLCKPPLGPSSVTVSAKPGCIWLNSLLGCVVWPVQWVCSHMVGKDSASARARMGLARMGGVV